MNISLFKNFTKGIGSRTLPQIVEEIRGDRYKDAISKIRKLVENGDSEKVSRLKKSLVAFTVSGLFEGGRKMSFLKTYNPFVILDIDKLDPKNLPDLILKIKGMAFTRVVFISPSGRGLKIIVEVDSEMKRHGAAYWQVMNFYKDSLMVEIDKSGKDITRLCFMSYDPEIYYNEGSTVFNVLKLDVYNGHSTNSQKDLIPGRAPDLSMEAANISGNYQEAFEVCVMQTDATTKFEKGNRNNYIYQLGVVCNHAGMPLEVAVKESKKRFEFDHAEMERTITSAYNWKPLVPENTPASSSTKTIVELPAKASPVIPEKIFSLLPDLLKKGCNTLKHLRERDLCLTSALGVLSGCLPNVIGKYDGRPYHPNLFVFIIGPSGCGKGCLFLVECLGIIYQNELDEKNEKEKEDYEKAWKYYELECTKFKKGKLEEPPLEPKAPVPRNFFFPANSSSAMIIRYLKNVEDAGIVFETEADSLGNVLKQDWGGYSELLRKAFHHETISYSRKANDESITINHPKLSVVLSGTPDQVINLIPSSENGLFSRFIFYRISAEDNWRSIKPSARVEDSHLVYKELAKDIPKMIHFLKAHPTKFDMTEAQWEVMDDTFREMYNTTRQDYGSSANSIVKRIGLICFRIAMTLSTIRKFEEKNKSKELICNATDFEVAMSLAKVFWEHALFMFDGLPKNRDNGGQFKEERKKLFFNNLPGQFMRKEAYAICPNLKMATRTGARYLKELLEEGYLSQSAAAKYGEYTKKPVILE